MRKAVLVALFATLVLAPSAQAAFPGHNGKIAFVSNADGDDEIYTINPDGTGLTQLTHNTVPDRQPSWSPDGTRIIFLRGAFQSASAEVRTMNADGTGDSFVTGPVAGQNWVSTVGWGPDGRIIYTFEHPECMFDAGMWLADADGSNKQNIGCFSFDGWIERTRWSPDGQKITFGLSNFGAFWDVHTVNVDGTGDTVVDSGDSFHPDWSPDASTIVFWGYGGPNFDPTLFTVPRNGGSRTPLTTADYVWPSWSPDGSKMVLERYVSPNIFITIINSDGTNPTPVGVQGTQPDWQPIPFTGYPRPQAASPLHVSLALAYNPCTAPNRTHGPPLDSPSCNPPERLSHLTVGTFDANGEPARSTGSVRFSAVGELPIDPNNGDQSDVKIRVKIADVRNRFDLTAYTGDVEVSAARRITDRDNTPEPSTATAQDHTFSFTVPCSPTSDKTVGSTCALETTADTLVPGSVKERQRTIWQLDRITVSDLGPELDPQGSPIRRVFMTQGIFVP